jgi:hypothetical protein
MAVIGSPNLWADFIEDNLIPDILDMVVDAWSSFIKPASNEPEVPLTRRFRIELERHRDLIRLPVRIEREVSVDDPATAKELGRIDLCFTNLGVRSDVYFAFECKLLNVLAKNGRIYPLAGKYVGTGGMMCFVGTQPQYAIGLKQGGMIGYVMDGEVEKAIRAVDKQIKRQYINLQMKSATGLVPSSKTSKSFVKESLHQLPDREFTLHHIFLPVS